MNDFYKAALNIAERKLSRDETPSKLKSPRLGTGGDFKNIFLWDTAFSVMWAKYHMDLFPVTDSLDNFYSSQKEDGFISREICPDGCSRWKKEHPISFAVPILAWAELELYKTTGNQTRLTQVYPKLKKYHEFNRSHYRLPNGLYFSDCFGCGMDDMPRWDDENDLLKKGGIQFDRSCVLNRGSEGDQDYQWLSSLHHLHFDWNRQLTWCDTSSQMAFDALNLSKIAAIINNEQDVTEWRDEHQDLKNKINTYCFDESKGFYFDRLDNKLLSRKHIGAFWTLIAEIAPPDKAERLINALTDKEQFNRPYGIPSLSADDKDYNLSSGYWRGPVWCPVNYMTLRGLQLYGREDVARNFAEKLYLSTKSIWEKTGTIWENYSPEQCNTPLNCGKDFCGWSALAPITIFREFLN